MNFFLTWTGTESADKHLVLGVNPVDLLRGRGKKNVEAFLDARWPDRLFLAYSANLSARLTHYGTTPAPV